MGTVTFRQEARTMAQVIERGSGRYLVRVFLGRDPSTGKRNYHNKTIRGTKKQAEAYGRKIQHEVDTGVFREAAHQTVGEYLDHWMEHTAHRKVRPRTLEGYEDVLRLHVRPVVGDVPMGSLSPQDVERIVTTMEAKGRSPQTIRNALTPLRHALNHAVKHGTIPQNPATADLVDLPKKVQRKVDTLTAEEAKGFVEAAKGERWGALYVVLLGGGMRPGEALGLKWDDFDGKAVRIDRALVRARNGRDWRLRETKTAKSRRTVPLPGFAVNALKEFRRLQAEDKLQAGVRVERDGADLRGREGGAPSVALPGPGHLHGTSSPKRTSRTFVRTTSGTPAPPYSWPPGSTRRSSRSAWDTRPWPSPSTRIAPSSLGSRRKPRRSWGSCWDERPQADPGPPTGGGLARVAHRSW
jgi:integrase